MNCPAVTRAISAETLARLATGRWLRTLYRQRVMSTESSASGNRPVRSATSNVRWTPGRLERFPAANRARRICASATSNPRAVMPQNPSACARVTSLRSQVPGRNPHRGSSLWLPRKPGGQPVPFPLWPKDISRRMHAFRQRQTAHTRGACRHHRAQQTSYLFPMGCSTNPSGIPMAVSSS